MKNIVQATTRVPQPSASQVSSEAVFYEDKRVFVSLARVAFGSQTFAVANISSVAPVVIKPPLAWKLLMLFIAGILFVIHDPMTVLLSYWFAAVPVLAFIVARPKHCVLLTTNAGEVNVMESADGRRVQTIVQAINEAIVARSSLDHAAYFHRRG